MSNLMDQRARDRIIQDLNTTLLVEAGAGSGKTTSLVGRLFELIRQGVTTVDHIAAITFTNKAASELRSRFRAKLEIEAAGALPPQESERVNEALRQISQCFIGTIHAFCGQLLRERPIESGVDPDFEEMEERTDQEFREQCWDEYVDLLRSSGQDGEIERLAELGIDVTLLRDVFHSVSHYEDVHIFTEPMDAPDFPAFVEEIRRFLDETIPYIPSNAKPRDYDKMQETVTQVRQMMNTLDLQRPRDVLKIAEKFDRNLDVRLNRWVDEDKARELRDARYPALRDHVIKPFLQQWREHLHEKLISIVSPALLYARQRRMEFGLLNFQDLLMKSAELLRSHPDVRLYFTQRFTHLLVDEFQDTDPIQAEVMFLLTGDPTIQDWRQQTPKPGSLFVVGDPKQSIYRFRRADISTYSFVKSRINQCGAVLELTSNFRSVKAIADYVNIEFQARFAVSEQTDGVQAVHVDMDAQRMNPKGKKARHGLYSLTTYKVDRHKQELIVEQDAERIAKAIAWACNGNLEIAEGDPDHPITRPARPEDFMILLRNRTYIDRYVERLEAYGIPAEPSGSRADAEELRALCQLIKSLHDPSDRIPLLAVLRGPLFGVSDNALYHYRMEGGTFSLNSLAEDAASFGPEAKSAWEALRQIRKYLDLVMSEPAFPALLKIVDDLGLIPSAAAGESGAVHSGTLISVLEQLQQNVDYNEDWQQLAEYAALLQDKVEIEGISLFAGRGGAVRIMNLHRAKGLEAPVVFLACPCGYKNHDATEHVDRTSDPAQGYFLIGRRDQYGKLSVIAQPKEWEQKNETERTFMAAEEDRLLYVATTRAKQLLIVSRYIDKPEIDPWGSLQAEEREWEGGEEVYPSDRENLPYSELDLSAFQLWREAAILPTYQKTSVTGQTKSQSTIELQRSHEGKGTAFGTLVHRGSQALGEGLATDQLEAFLKMVGEEEGAQPEWLPEAAQMIQAVIKSEIWQRSLSARHRFFEYSFTALEREANTELNTLLSGVIDILFQEEEGWVMVDFKTDLFEPSQLRNFVDYYTPQIQAYANIWRETFGRTVKECGLYFLQQNRYVHVPT